MSSAGPWIGLFILAAIIIYMGAWGKTGRMFAVFFAPSIVLVQE